MASFVSAIFLGLSWITPNHFPPWVSWLNEAWAFVAVMWAMGAALISKDERQRLVSFPRSAWPLLLLAIVVVLQGAIGRILFLGDVAILLFYLILCMFALSIGYKLGGPQVSPSGQAAGQSLIPQFAMLVLVGGFFSAVIALVQVLDVWETVSWIHRMPGPHRPGANLGQTNQLATFVLFSLASAAYLFELKRLSVVTALLVVAFLLVGLAVTESRTGALSLLLMAAWWTVRHRRLGFLLSSRGVVLWLVFFACCFWLWPIVLDYILISGSTVSTVNLQAGTRLLVWPQLWQAILLRPWFGWGLLKVPEALNAVLHLYPHSDNFTYAHSAFLDLAVGIGLPLTALLVLVTCVWLWRRARDTRDITSWYCLAFALPFGVHSMLEFPFAYAYLLAPVMFLLGVLERNLAQHHVVSVRWGSMAVAWTLTSAAMIWSVSEYLAIEEDFRVARFEILKVGQTANNYQRPNILLLTQMDAFLEGIRLSPTATMAPKRLELARVVAMHFPGPATQNRYAMSLALNGDSEEALRQLLVMRAMYGEKTYEDIKLRWVMSSEGKFPQLRLLKLP